MNASETEVKLDRKQLKTDDTFLRVTGAFFRKLGERPKLLMYVALGCLLVFTAVALFIARKNSIANKAADALFDARQTYETELKAVFPPEPVASPVPGKAKKAELEHIFENLDVDAKFPETVKTLKKVISEFPSSSASFSATLELGTLYFNHGQVEKSAEWFNKGLANAPGKLEKGILSLQLGYIAEKNNQLDEALTKFDQAISNGINALGADAMFAKARILQKKGSKDQAAAVLDSVIKEFPGSSYADQAEVTKGVL